MELVEQRYGQFFVIPDWCGLHHFDWALSCLIAFQYPLTFTSQTMIPITLSLSGFLSYQDPVEIDFSSLTLACISGPNGSGKSSILDAITWALFGQARKRDESIINTNSESAKVALTFLYEGNSYRVIRENSRGKAVYLDFQIASVSDVDMGLIDRMDSQKIWKPLSERTIRHTQSRIEEILRLDYETFINASFFLQGKADQFTQQRPGDRKRILSSILGLDVWESYRKRTADLRKSVEDEIKSLDGRLTEIDNELAEEQNRKKRLSELRANLEMISKTRSIHEKNLEEIRKLNASLEEQRRLVNALSQQLLTAKNRKEELINRLNERKREKDNYQIVLSKAEEITKNHESLTELRNSLEEWVTIAGRFREQENQRQEPIRRIAYEKARLDQELTDLRSKAVEIDNLQKTIPRYQEKIELIEAEIRDILSSMNERTLLANGLLSAQEKLANAKAENPRLKSEMEELRFRIDRLQKVEGPACPTCGQPLSPEEKRSLVENLTTIGKALGDKYRANQQLLNQADKEVTSIKRKIQELSTLDEALLAKKDALNASKTEIKQIQSRHSSWERDGAKRLLEVEKSLDEETFALDARKELESIDADLKTIGYDASEHDALRRQEQQMRPADQEFRALELARAAVDPLENEIDNLDKQIQEIQADVQDQRKAYQQAAANLNATEAQAPDLRHAQRELLDIQEEENQLRLEVGAAQQKVLVLDDLKTRKERLTQDRESLGNQVGKYKQLERAFGKDGVPALLIESAIPQIEMKTNQILDRLSDGKMSVRFLTQKAYKDKKRLDLMETLEIQIRDESGFRDYEMFSGGESFKVNFSIRLALSEILAQRAGARLQTLVIDEGFGSQDALGRQRLIEVLNIIKADFAKILVITHIDSLKEAFLNRIDVTKSRRGSVIQVV